MGGVPVFIGTRVPLQTLFDYLESSISCAKEFLEDFPHLQTSALQIIEIVLLSRLLSPLRLSLYFRC